MLRRGASPALRRSLRSGARLGTNTLAAFSKDRGDLLAAALAFHTLLSIAPLIVVAVAIAGLVLGQGPAREEMSRLLRETIGAKGAHLVNEWVGQASKGGSWASLVGIGLTLVAASRLGMQLRDALNQIWQIDVRAARGIQATLTSHLRQRFYALALVVAAGPVLLAAFASRLLFTGLQRIPWAASPWQSVALQALQFSSSLTLVAGLSAVLFRYVPDARVGWKSAALGGSLTSALFNSGNALIGLYLARAGATAYGAAATLIVMLLWLYFSAQMFLLGAEFTRAYASGRA